MQTISHPHVILVCYISLSDSLKNMLTLAIHSYLSCLCFQTFFNVLVLFLVGFFILYMFFSLVPFLWFVFHFYMCVVLEMYAGEPW